MLVTLEACANPFKPLHLSQINSRPHFCCISMVETIPYPYGLSFPNSHQTLNPSPTRMLPRSRPWLVAMVAVKLGSVWGRELGVEANMLGGVRVYFH